MFGIKLGILYVLSVLIFNPIKARPILTKSSPPLLERCPAMRRQRHSLAHHSWRLGHQSRGETHRSAVNTRRSNERSLLAPRVDGFVAPSIKCSGVLLLVLDAMDSDAPINIRTSALHILQ